MSPFWLPVSMTSTPHSSIRNASQPRLATQSTMKRAEWPVSLIAADNAGMSFRTELAVSTCTASTALISWPLSRRSRSATASGSIGLEEPKSMLSTSAPSFVAMFPHAPANNPVGRVSTRSPLLKVFVRQASQAPWPLAM